jgi:DNA-binding NarL/FixJ family response regulator
MPLKILLIDTDADRARALAEILSESGYAEILRAPSGPDLAETVERTKPDLVIIDMGCLIALLWKTSARCPPRSRLSCSRAATTGLRRGSDRRRRLLL